MPDSWTRALNLFSYPVDLGCYQRRHEFPGYFEILIAGDRSSTIAFENHFRENAPYNIAAYFEVVFWKLYSLPLVRQGSTDRIADYILYHNVQPMDLWNAVLKFIENQNIENLRRIRGMLGITTKVLATTLTIPALACSDKFTMVDTQVAKWVNEHFAEHNIDRNNNLTPFNFRGVLRDNDFNNYLNWVAWCRETSKLLTRLNREKWRPRDVEMAVFTAQRNKLSLNPLIRLWNFTLNFELWTLNSEPWTLNLELWTLNFEPWTLNFEL